MSRLKTISDKLDYIAMGKLNKEQMEYICEINQEVNLKDIEIERLNKENTILRQNSQYLVKQKDELEEVINKAIEYIKDYLCSYDYTSAEFKDIVNVFMDLLDTLQGVDKE